MPTEIWCALIAGVVTLTTTLLTIQFSLKRDREKQRDDLKAELIKYHEKNKEKIEEIRVKDLRELGDDVSSMGASLQQKIAVIETQIGVLSDRVEKHNNVVERVFRLEETDKLLDEKISVANHRILDLEQKKA